MIFMTIMTAVFDFWIRWRRGAGFANEAIVYAPEYWRLKVRSSFSPYLFLRNRLFSGPPTRFRLLPDGTVPIKNNQTAFR